MTRNELYAPMLERETAAIEKEVRRFRESHTSDELFRAVSQFALLAASPSQHGKHALLACVAAKEIEATVGARYDDLLAQCACYAALSRLPWSEPPITDPPEYGDGDASTEVIDDAIARRDRLQGERWLAARLDRGNIAGEFFRVAAADLSDFGHKLIVAVGVWKLAQFHDRPDWFPFLRVAIGEWTAYGEQSPEVMASEAPRDEVIEAAVANLEVEKGSLEAFHRVVTCDAAIEAARLADDPSIERRVLSTICHREPSRRAFGAPQGRLREGSSAQSEQIEPKILRRFPPQDDTLELPIYPLARDYAEYLKSFAIAQRLGRPEIIAAAKYNRDHGPSFDEWSFA